MKKGRNSCVKEIQALRLYSRVARLGSFSAAAREFGLAQSQVSRMIADLEQDLGAKLLTRSTRAVVLTEAGAEYLTRTEPILAALEDAANSVRETRELRGRLRVGMPTTLGLRKMIPHLAPFTARHPDLHIEILLEDKWQDTVREAIDVGIRVGQLPEGTGTARLISTIERVVVASPAYLAQAGIPVHPNDLVRHRIVGGPAASQATSWQFRKGDETVSIELHPHVSGNSNSGAVACATAGLGITSTTLWACEEELAQGTLVRVCPDWTPPEIPVNAYFPLGRATRLAARAFVDFIVPQLRATAA